MLLLISCICSEPSNQRATVLAVSTISTITSHTPTYGVCPGRRCSSGLNLHSATEITSTIQVTNSMLTL